MSPESIKQLAADNGMQASEVQDGAGGAAWLIEAEEVDHAGLEAALAAGRAQAQIPGRVA